MMTVTLVGATFPDGDVVSSLLAVRGGNGP